VNLSGKTTTRKIVVFESDDWGSIRMPSVETYNKLKKAGLEVDKSPYCLYDSLCSAQDMYTLYTVLQNHKDSMGNFPIITANAVVANPDFDKIKASDYQIYTYETIDETFNSYFPNEKPLEIWSQGISQKLFFPQFHGREHVNVSLWLEKLQQNDIFFLTAFEEKCWGLSNDVYLPGTKSVQATFDYNLPEELNFIKESVEDGLKLFKKIFGYQSKSFIPNNYIWPSELNLTLMQNGVEIMQGMKYQLLPKLHGEKKRKKIRRYNGQIIGTKPGLLQTVRNVQFEPSLMHPTKKNVAVSNCLKQIQTAFFWKKPAVISTHRINFCGTLSKQNRISNLFLFNELLCEIIKKWPEVEFMTTIELANTMK
jgi:hypothetical protein